MNEDMKQQWRNELGSDSAWDAFPSEAAPPLASGFKARSWWPHLTVAASLFLAVSLSANLVLYERLSTARTDTLLALLQQDSPMVTLATLEKLRSRDLSDRSVNALFDVVRFSDDPNAQLTALEILYELQRLDSTMAVEQLLSETQRNTDFIRAAIRSITEESV